jgi:hypothetical protein
MPQTTPDTHVPPHRNRALRIAVGITAGFGPLFLFALLISQMSWFAPRVGVSEAFVSNNIRSIVAVGLLGSFGVSYALLALAKRLFPSSRTAA